jgi:hypothetical protein
VLQEPVVQAQKPRPPVSKVCILPMIGKWDERVRPALAAEEPGR